MGGGDLAVVCKARRRRTRVGSEPAPAAMSKGVRPSLLQASGRAPACVCVGAGKGRCVGGEGKGCWSLHLMLSCSGQVTKLGRSLQRRGSCLQGQGGPCNVVLRSVCARPNKL